MPVASHASLSAGAAVGLGVGACLIVLGLVGLGFWLYKRGQRTGQAMAGAPLAYNESPMVYPPYSGQVLPVEVSANIKGYNDNPTGFKPELP